MPNKDAIITVRVPSAVKEALLQAAKDDMRTLASLVTKVLADHVRKTGYLKAATTPAAATRRKER